MTPENKKIIIRIAVFGFGYAVFIGWLLPYFDVSNIRPDVRSLDIRTSYSPDDVRNLFNLIGYSGMQQYLKFIIADNFYILIYCILAYFILAFSEQNSGRLGTFLKGIRWLPFIVGLTDLTENINTLILIRRFPEISQKAVSFGSALTTSKWYEASVLAGLIICLIFYMVLRNLLWRLQHPAHKLSDHETQS